MREIKNVKRKKNLLKKNRATTIVCYKRKITH